MSLSGKPLNFVDIGANLMDERFTKGSYRGKVRHEPDFDQVIEVQDRSVYGISSSQRGHCNW